MDTQGVGARLREAVQAVPDPRARRGQRHPVAAVRRRMTVAGTSGARRRSAIAHWGRLQDPAVVAALGFARGRTPAVAPVHEVTRRLDPTATSGVLARWPKAPAWPGGAASPATARGGGAVTPRGRPRVPGATWWRRPRMRPAGCWRTWGGSGANHEAERTVAPRRLAQLPVRGAVITGAARSWQRRLREQIRAAGGDDRCWVKGNQPTLEAASTVVVAAPPPEEPFPTLTAPDRHGRRWEGREVTLTTALRGSWDGPGGHPVGRLVRRWDEHERTGGETRLRITSLGADVEPAAGVRRARGHWQIEHGLPAPRDVTLGEDASTMRTGAAPQVRAARRTAGRTGLRAPRATTIAAALRDSAWQGSALAVRGITLE